MEFMLSSEPMSGTTFVLTIENENIGVKNSEGNYSFNIPLKLKRSTAWDNRQNYPVLLSLHATVWGNMPSLPIERVPADFDNSSSLQYLNTEFPLTNRALQIFESKRLPGNPAILPVAFFGTMVLLGEPDEAEVGNGWSSYRKVTGSAQVTIQESQWIRILKEFGYPYRRIIDVPAFEDVQHLHNDIQEAVTFYNQALDLFVQGRYRPAIQLCRQAKEVLIQKNPQLLLDMLIPILGVTKAKMIDDGLRSLADTLEGASHPHGGASHPHANPKKEYVEIDREAAEYVLGQFAFILHYIDTKLR